MSETPLPPATEDVPMAEVVFPEIAEAMQNLEASHVIAKQALDALPRIAPIYAEMQRMQQMWDELLGTAAMGAEAVTPSDGENRAEIFTALVREDAVKVWELYWAIYAEVCAHSAATADVMLAPRKSLEEFMTLIGIGAYGIKNIENTDALWHKLGPDNHVKSTLRPVLLLSSEVILKGIAGQFSAWKAAPNDEFVKHPKWDPDATIRVEDAAPTVPTKTSPVDAVPAATKMSTLKKLTTALGLTLAGGGVGYLIGNNGEPDAQPDNTPTPANVQQAVPQQPTQPVNAEVLKMSEKKELNKGVTVQITHDGKILLTVPAGIEGRLYGITDPSKPELSRTSIAAFSENSTVMTLPAGLMNNNQVMLAADVLETGKDGFTKSVRGLPVVIRMPE